MHAGGIDCTRTLPTRNHNKLQTLPGTHPIWLQSAEQSVLGGLWTVQWEHCLTCTGEEAMRYTTARMGQQLAPQPALTVLANLSALSSLLSRLLVALLVGS